MQATPIATGMVTAHVNATLRRINKDGLSVVLTYLRLDSINTTSLANVPAVIRRGDAMTYRRTNSVLSNLCAPLGA